MAIEKFDFYIGMAITGISTGLGGAIGLYIANKHIIDKLEGVKKRIQRR
jgi:hypothetical protein